MIDEKKIRLLIFVAFILPALCFNQVQLAAEDEHRITAAVYELTPQGVSPNLSATLTGVLRNRLQKTGLFRMITQNDLRRILDNLARRQKIKPDCDSDACMAEIANALGVEMMVSGSIGKVGETFVINLRLLDVDKVETVNTVVVKCACKEDVLIERIEDAALELFKLLPAGSRKKGEALLNAAQTGNLDIVKRLLNEGANPDVRLEKGQTPLHLAAFGGFEKIVRLLLKKGAQVNPLTIARQTPLLFAAYNGHDKVVKILLESGADMEIAAVGGNTPLHLAAAEGRLRVVEFLVENGAELNTSNQKQQTPLTLARNNDHSAVVAFLHVKGAK